MSIDKAQCGNWMLTGPQKEQISINAHDREILRNHAKRLRELAELPIQQEKVRLWTAHNDLQDTRPLIFIDPENGWNEIIPWDTLECEGELAKDWEMWLRKEVIWGEKMKDDRVQEAKFYLPYTAVDTEWGVDTTPEGMEGVESGGAYTFHPPIEDMETDLDLVKCPEIHVDEEATRMAYDLACEIFDGILTVEIRHKWWHSMHLTWDYSNLRGLENMLYDFYDYPDEVHQLMRKMTDGYKAKAHYLQEHGYLCYNSNSSYVGSGGYGFSTQLPACGPQGQSTGAAMKDMWLFLESQETGEVSPQMFAEFVLPYQIELAEDFGMLSYGCCEPINPRWDYVKKIPHLRRVSVSAWANVETMSEQLGSDYVYSHKPSPSYLAVPQMDEDYIRTYIRDFLKKTRRNHVEIMMKDNHTLGKNPENAYRWVQIVREEIENMD